MIVMHIDPECRACQGIRESLEDTALAHRVDCRASAHSITDDEETFTGHAEMARHVEDLARLAHQWTLFQSDICYCLDEY